MAGQGGAVTGLGVLESESTAFSHVQTQLAHGVSVLLCGRVIEFVVTGCLSGGGDMIKTTVIQGCSGQEKRCCAWLVQCMA